MEHIDISLNYPIAKAFEEIKEFVNMKITGIVVLRICPHS